MPRQKSFLTVVRELVQAEVRSAIQSLFGNVSPKRSTTNGGRRRRKARGKWRPGGPGRPPKAVAEKLTRRRTAVAPPKAKNGRRKRRKRGRGRPSGSTTKAA
jgi:hypothetical protein